MGFLVLCSTGILCQNYLQFNIITYLSGIIMHNRIGQSWGVRPIKNSGIGK